MLNAIKDIKEANEPEIVSQQDEFVSPELIDFRSEKKTKKTNKQEQKIKVEVKEEEENEVEVKAVKEVPKRFKMTKDYTIQICPRAGIAITLSFRKNQIISDPDTIKHLGNQAPMVPSE